SDRHHEARKGTGVSSLQRCDGGSPWTGIGSGSPIRKKILRTKTKRAMRKTTRKRKTTTTTTRKRARRVGASGPSGAGSAPSERHERNWSGRLDLNQRPLAPQAAETQRPSMISRG